MALVFKLALLASSRKFFGLAAVADLNSPREVAQKADEFLQRGDLSGAEELFIHYNTKFQSSKQFRHEYASFMLKTGQFQKLIDECSETDTRHLEEAKNSLNKLFSGVKKQIISLISTSPYSLTVNLAMIENLLLEKKINQAEKYADFAMKMYPDSNDLFYYRIYIMLSKGKHEEVSTVLKDSQSSLWNTIKTLAENFVKFSTIEDPHTKMKYFSMLYREALRGKMNMEIQLNIFNPLYRNIVEVIVKTGCDSMQRVLSFAKLLNDLDGSQESQFYFIKSLAIENRLNEAQEMLDRTELAESLKSYLAAFIGQKRKEMQKQMEEEQRRRQEEEQRRQRHFQQSHSTPKAGQDFLKYYELLGVNRNATPEALKKAHLKMAKKATKKAAAKKNLPNEEKDKDLKLVNKAYQILSDPKKRQAYDMGIDPETGPQAPSEGHHGHFQADDQIQELFKSFFGGQSGGRGRRRSSQFIFL